MKKIFLSLSIIALFAITACSAWRSPSSAARHFYKSIAEGQFDEALGYTTASEQIDRELYVAIMEKVQQSIAERGGIEKIEIIHEQIAEEQSEASVTTLLTFADGSQQEEVCDVVLIDKRWKVDVDLDSK